MVDLKKFVTSQLLDIIQWQDDSRDTVSWLFPDEDKEIKNGAQLIVRVRAFGTYDFRVVEPKTFLKEVAGTDHNFRLDEFADTMRSRLVSMFSDALGAAKIPVVGLVGRYGELGDALLNVINPKIREKYGLELGSFIIENVSVPPEVEQAIDKRAAMSTLGNLNDYVKYQMGQSVVQPGGTGGGAGGPMEMAMGFAMAQQMMQGMAAPGSGPAAGAFPGAGAAAGSPAAPAAPALPELMGPADAAKLMGVSEADVMAEITAGNLKARQIGSQWRIAQSALDEFLRG